MEYNNYVQSAENTGPVDLDNDPTTTFNNITFGNNTFRHFTHDITDWAGSLGLNYVVNDNLAFFAAGSRGYKMPALDDLLNASAQEQVNLFDSREVRSIEGGVKTQLGRVAFTVNGFYTDLKNQINQGAELDAGGGTVWVIRESPDNRSFGAEIEAIVAPAAGLQFQGSATFLRGELGGGVDTLEHLKGERLARRAQSPRQHRGDLFAARLVRPPAPRRLALGRRPADRESAHPGGQHRAPGLQLLQLRREPRDSAVRCPAQRGSVERIPGQGAGGRATRAWSASGGAPFFLARPLLPRRLLLGITYDFGGRGGQTLEGEPGL